MEKHETAFKQIKKAFTSSTVMLYFDHTKHTDVVTDASPYSLSVIITQSTPHKDDRKVIVYVSRSLTPMERRYFQTECDAFAIERLQMYGSPHTLYMHCKPTELILKNPHSKPSACIERWSLQLQDYCFQVEYTKGQQNPSDFLSRHPCSNFQATQHEQSAGTYVKFLTIHATLNVMTLEEIKLHAMVQPCSTSLQPF